MPTVVNSIAYRNGKRLAEVQMPDISEAIKEPNTFVLLGLHESDPSVLLQIQQEFSLHDLAIEDARKAHQRSKIETYGDSIFIVVKTAQLKTGTSEEGADQEAGKPSEPGCTIEFGETHFFAG